MAQLRLTRRIDSGLLKIKDRVKSQDEDGKETFTDVFHILGVEHSPRPLLVLKKRKVAVEGKPGEFTWEEIPNDWMAAKDEKGKTLWGKAGKPFDVNDVDYVLKLHGGILEKC